MMLLAVAASGATARADDNALTAQQADQYANRLFAGQAAGKSSRPPASCAVTMPRILPGIPPRRSPA